MNERRLSKCMARAWRHTRHKSLSQMRSASGFLSLLVLLMGAMLPCSLPAEYWKPDGIWQAACIGKIGYVQRYLKEGVSINARDKRGFTPLMHALNTFQFQIVPDLLVAGADANVQDYDGTSALSLACRAGDAASAQLLLKAGARLEQGALSETSCFALALKSRSPQMVEALLGAGTDPQCEIRAENGRWPALVYAARVSSADVVELLVRRGIPVDTPCQDKTTPLIHAALSGNLGVIKRLITLGANLNAENVHGANALRYAAHYGNEPAFAHLLKAGGAVPRAVAEWLPTVMRWGNEEILQTLSAKGVAVPSRDPALTLAEAARRGDLTAVNHELESAFPNFSHEAHAALFAAAAGGKVEVIERLNQFAEDGGHLRCGDSAWFSQLHHAVVAGNNEALEYYLARGVNLDAQNFLGRTPLMLAAMSGRMDMVERLAKAGARIKMEDREGRNALDLALQHRNSDIATWLGKNGIKPTSKTAEPALLTEVARANPLKASMPTVSVAALPFFILGDAWYPSVEAAHDFGLALQAGLQNIDGVRWVERAEIEKIESELVRGTAGLLSPSQKMNIGRWVKADILLTGVLSVDEGLGRELKLQTVDAHRGDLLAERKLWLKQPSGLPYTVASSHLEAAAAAAREVLAEARTRLCMVESQRVLAPLFIGNRTARTSRLDAKVMDLHRAILRAGSDNNIRVLNLEGSSQATYETELAISGLALGNPDEWKSVADYYLWGWIEETGDASVPFDEMPVRMVLEVWSGGTVAKSFSVETKVTEMEAAAKKLTRQVVTTLLASPRPQTTQNDRLHAAKILFDHARELIGKEPSSMRLDQGNHWLVTRWLLSMRALDAARFFAPEDAEIAATWLLQRWYDSLHFPTAEDHDPSSARTFWNRWRRKTDWDEHISRFGMEGLRKVALAVRKNDKTLFSVFQTAKDAPLDWHFQINEDIYKRVLNGGHGIPDGMPMTLRRKWCNELAQATADSLLKALSERTERTHYSPSFMSRDLEFFLPVEKRLELAKSQWRLIDTWNSNPMPDKIVEERLLMLRWFDEAGRHDEALATMKLHGRYFSADYSGVYLPWISASENAPPPVSMTVETPTKHLSKRIHAPLVPVPMPAAWEYPTIDHAVSVTDAHVIALSCGLDGQERTVVAKWVPGTNLFEPLAPFPVPKIAGEMEFLAHADGFIWLGGKAYGVGMLDLANRKFTKFTDQDGLPFGSVSHAAPAGDDFYLAGLGAANQPMLAKWNATLGWRSVPLTIDNQQVQIRHIMDLTSFGSRLYCFYQPTEGANATAILDAKTGKWQKVTGLPAPKGLVSGIWADESGLWVLDSETLTMLPLQGGTPTTLHFPPDIRVNVNIPKAVHDGDWLWIVAQELAEKDKNVAGVQPNSFGRLLAIHKPTRSYRGAVDVTGGTMIGLMVTPDAIYPLVKDISPLDAPSILKLDKKAVIRDALK